MKYLIAFLLFSIVTVTVKAQISFSADEYFGSFSNMANTGISYSSSDLSGLDALIAKAGAGMNWDFGNRAYTQDAASASTTTILPPAGAPKADDPDFASATHVLRSTPNDPTKPVGYLFVKFNQDGLWFIGFSQDSAGVKTKIAAYAPPLQQIKFPLQYQQSWQSTSDVHVEGFPPGTVYTIKDEAIADAYGTLITPTSVHKVPSSPMASNDALRVNTKTTTTIAFPPFLNQTTVTYTYQWYTKNGHGATIDADTNKQPTGVSYSVLGSNAVANYSSAEDIMDIRLSVNPASNTETNLFYTMKQDGNSQVSVVDLFGRKVIMLQNGRAVAGQNIIPIDPSKLSAGIYFIRVNADGMTAIRKLIITK